MRRNSGPRGSMLGCKSFGKERHYGPAAAEQLPFFNCFHGRTRSKATARGICPADREAGARRRRANHRGCGSAGHSGRKITPDFSTPLTTFLVLLICARPEGDFYRSSQHSLQAGVAQIGKRNACSARLLLWTSAVEKARTKLAKNSSQVG